MVKFNLHFTLILCVLTIWVFELAQAQGGSSTSSHLAPAPSVDCSTLILNMADCLSFVSNDSTETKPQRSCCKGLKTVVKTNADCLCQAFKSSAQFGVALNVTKAMALPAACKVSTPSVASCALSISPVGAPALSPTSAPAETYAPPPTLGSSDALKFTMSFGSMVASIGIALLSCL